MADLNFPTTAIVGRVDWDGAYTESKGPVLARGTIQVPDGVPVSLEVESISGLRHGPGVGWRILPSREPVDLSFLVDLPGSVITSLTLTRPFSGSTASLLNLSPRLEKLFLADCGLGDPELDHLVQLENLTHWQSWGNCFTDRGVQKLSRLRRLRRLFLEEATLSLDGLAVGATLPDLELMGVSGASIPDDNFAHLTTQLHGVRVVR